MSLVAGHASDRAIQERQTFLQLLQCPVAARLNLIAQRGERTRSKDRFLVIATQRSPQSYVQCIFHDNSSMLRCEASSGHFAQKAGEPRRFSLSVEARNVLARLGFDVSRDDRNFPADFPAKDDRARNGVARTVLLALFDAYGVRLHHGVKARSPMIPRGDPELAPGDCAPAS